jgi:hypothetical protein
MIDSVAPRIFGVEMRTVDREPKLGEFKNECRHFNGIQHERCAAGVLYHSFDRRIVELPCLPDSRIHKDRSVANCPSISLLTQGELLGRYREHTALIDAFCKSIESGKCFECGTDIEPSRIVGRCKYAACGHRIGQVAIEGDE